MTALVADPLSGAKKKSRHPRSAPSGPRVLLITEGTYPFAIGGVSSWCNILLKGLADVRWQVLPITATNRSNTPLFRLPPNAEIVGHVRLWSENNTGINMVPSIKDPWKASLPATLTRSLISWRGDHSALVQALLWCRRHPTRIRPAFRSGQAWATYSKELETVRGEQAPGAGTPPALNSMEAAMLYQVLYWIARTAATRTPETDLLHVTAAGWAGIPAIVHKALHGTPILLTEHGVYVRESYLAAARSGDSAGQRFVKTRLARGLARASYAAADVVSPVTAAHVAWEKELGVNPNKIQVIHNGVEGISDTFEPAPGIGRVVSVGRVDPLKDVHTMLRVAVEVVKRIPHAEFRYFGPVTDGEQAYGASCHELHSRLGLVDRFTFMGNTHEPERAMRESDIVLMTSISEGMPLGIIEAMAQGRPVVATDVGGVRGVLRGCGVITKPGDTHGIAMAVSTLLNDSDLARKLGERGHARARSSFSRAACIQNYGLLIAGLAERRFAA